MSIIDNREKQRGNYSEGKLWTHNWLPQTNRTLTPLLELPYTRRAVASTKEKSQDLSDPRHPLFSYQQPTTRRL